VLRRPVEITTKSGRLAKVRVEDSQLFAAQVIAITTIIFRGILGTTERKIVQRLLF